MAVPAHPRLAARIAMQGMPHYVIAAAARINPNALGAILSGRIAGTAEQRRRIAEVLDVPVDALFEDDLVRHEVDA